MTEWVAGTVDPDYKPEVSIDGVGRVGTPSRMRSRARHHWVVSYYDGTRSATGYEHKIAEHLGTFKRGYQAAEAAKKFAEEKGWAINSYVESVLCNQKAVTAVKERRDAMKDAVDALLAAAFVPAGSTQTQSVRIATVQNPVFGGIGGERRTFGGRQRYAKTGTDFYATVGKVTTCVYSVRNGKFEAIANLSTKDLDRLSAVLKNLEGQ